MNPSLSMVVAFVVVTLTFLAGTAVSQLWAFSIAGPAAEIATNAAPSIRHLAAALSKLRKIQALLARACLDATHDGALAQLAEIEQAQRELDAQLRAYLSLPDAFLGEAAMWRGADRLLADLDRAIDDVTADLLRGDPAAASRTLTTEFDPVAERLSNALRRTVDLNAAAALEHAATIEAVRSRAARLLFLLDGLAVVVTIVAAIFVGRTFSHYQRLQERNAELLRKQVEELEAFAGRVAHDILGPLSGVSLGLQLIDRAEDRRKGAQVLVRARSCVWSIQVIVRDLLAFALSGARPARSEPHEVAASVRHVLADLQAEAEEERVELREDLEAVPPVSCAPGVLLSLVSNLVRNAVKHMGSAPVRTVTVRSRARESRVRVEVTDTGPGIPHDLLGALFTPYMRGRDPARPGLGLGLATVRRLAEAHGGAVGVDTALGLGSTFWFELPQAAAAAAARRPETATAP